MAVHFHADNCSEHNKNNCMMQYLTWRVITSRHTNITLVVGHTKFSPDWCFGLFKCRYRRTNVSSLRSIAQLVNDSTECNISQWLKKMRVWSFQLTSGQTFCSLYEHCDQKVSSLHDVFISSMLCFHKGALWFIWSEDWSSQRAMEDELPEAVPPKDLSAERQWYLHEQIHSEDKDTVCPLPAVC